MLTLNKEVHPTNCSQPFKKTNFTKVTQRLVWYHEMK